MLKPSIGWPKKEQFRIIKLGVAGASIKGIFSTYHPTTRESGSSLSASGLKDKFNARYHTLPSLKVLGVLTKEQHPFRIPSKWNVEHTSSPSFMPSRLRLANLPRR